MKVCLLISYAKADIFKMNQTGQFFRNTSYKMQNRSFFILFRAAVWQFAPVSKGKYLRRLVLKPKVELLITSDGTEKEKKNEAVFVIFMSKALHFNEFSACFI